MKSSNHSNDFKYLFIMHRSALPLFKGFNQLKEFSPLPSHLSPIKPFYPLARAD